MRQIYIDLSTDNGKNFTNITENYGLSMEQLKGSRGKFDWVIPDSIRLEDGTGKKISTRSNTCLIRVRPCTKI